MSDYIGREDAIKVINQGRLTKLIDADVAESGLKALSAADVVPVVHAYWRNTGSGQECSACKEIQYGYDTGRHFCANCGAKMDGEE